MARRRKTDSFATLAVRAGEEQALPASASSFPIYQTSTFFFDNPEQAYDAFAGKKPGFVYSRISNPTVKAFEDKMACLEQAEAAVAFSSGMAAISAVFLSLLRPGDELIASSRIYSGAREFMSRILPAFGCRARRFTPGPSAPSAIRKLVNKKTRLLYFETPSNPELSILDLAQLAEVAKETGIFSVVDNTFATPYLQRPHLHGIDCVVHSATKYIGGHGDAVGGLATGPERFISGLRTKMLLNLGACLAPMNAWLYLRGLKTLHLRMDRHSSTAMELAEFLAGHAKVRDALYPGLPTHAGHATAAAQMTHGFGGIVSFRLASRSHCVRFMRRLQFCRQGVSLGDAETIALHYPSMFMPKAADSQCRSLGFDPLLIRISTGLEDSRDIIADIREALRGI